MLYAHHCENFKYKDGDLNFIAEDLLASASDNSASYSHYEYCPASVRLSYTEPPSQPFPQALSPQAGDTDAADQQHAEGYVRVALYACSRRRSMAFYVCYLTLWYVMWFSVCNTSCTVITPVEDLCSKLRHLKDKDIPSSNVISRERRIRDEGLRGIKDRNMCVKKEDNKVICVYMEKIITNARNVTIYFKLQIWSSPLMT